jgi:DNA-3-methyladenine glycosylase
LGITTGHTGTDLTGEQVWISDHEYDIPTNDIKQGKRIGIDYAGPDANLPYRFFIDTGWLEQFFSG